MTMSMERRDERAAPATGFAGILDAAVTRNDSLVCVGLDPDESRIPASAWDPGDVAGSLVRFNAAIIEATADLVCAYKPNLGFYVAFGVDGLAALAETRRLIPADIPVILDCKVGDIGSTAAAYARGYFDAWGFDAITVNPYLGEDSLAPFLTSLGRGVLVVCKTSNPGSGDLQDLPIPIGPETGTLGETEPLYLTLARRVAAWGERYLATPGLVVGATYPADLARVRAVAPDVPILLPGVGTQAGDIEGAVRAGIDARGRGLLVSASRSITYAGDGPDFAARAREAAMALRDAVNAVRAGH
ncbi:MAG: orotidine-5'-phosphate decarboxylase [Thermomicrobiales bacterium]